MPQTGRAEVAELVQSGAVLDNEIEASGGRASAVILRYCGLETAFVWDQAFGMKNGRAVNS